MTVIALASAKGSPGVTTSALALAAVWPGRVVVAECDPAGGDITPGYLQARTSAAGGLLGIAMALRRTTPAGAAERITEFTVDLDPDRQQVLLPGLRDPAQAATLAPLWPGIVDTFHELTAQDPAMDVLADMGRLDTTHTCMGLVTQADLVVVVLRPTLAAVSATQPRLTALKSQLPDGGGDRVGLLLVGSGPYSAREIALALDTSVIGVLAHDPAAAAVFSGDRPAGRSLARSRLLRSARSCAEQLHARAQSSDELGRHAQRPHPVSAASR